MRVVYDFVGDGEGQVKLNSGTTLTVTTLDDTDGSVPLFNVYFYHLILLFRWLVGTLPNGQKGFFPKAYAEVVDDTESTDVVVPTLATPVPTGPVAVAVIPSNVKGAELRGGIKKTPVFGRGRVVCVNFSVFHS